MRQFYYSPSVKKHDTELLPIITSPNVNRFSILSRIPVNNRQKTFADGIRFSLHVNAFLQCFDAVGWVAGRASGL